MSDCLIKDTYSNNLFWEGYDIWFQLYAGSLNWKLCKAVAYKESEYNANAIGEDGEIGVMQIMFSTAQDMGCYDREELFNPEKNIKYGCKYLNWLRIQFIDGGLQELLVAYNWGIGNVKKTIDEYGIKWYLHVPLVVKQYYEKVMLYYSQLGG